MPLKTISPLRNRILTLTTPRVTARDSFEAEPTSPESPVALDCLEKIGRAARMKSATHGGPAEPGEQRRKRPLVGPDEITNEQNHRQGRRIEARLTRRKPSSFLLLFWFLLLLLIMILRAGFFGDGLGL